MNSLQAHCPICGNAAVAEFFEPSGTALCLQCGAILRRLRDRLVSSYQMEPEHLTLDTALAENLDSLDAAELLMALEEEMGVTISDKEAEEIKTVKDVVHFIRSYGKKS